VSSSWQHNHYRVEPAHEKLEKYLMDSKEDLARGSEAIQYMLQLQFNEIQTSFGGVVLLWNIDTNAGGFS
jgi:hypothetical protein